MQPLALATVFAPLVSAGAATVYLIRHGEKPDDGDGLNAQGAARAQCLRTVFGAGSQYEVGHIMAQTPQSGMKSPAEPPLPPSEIHLGKTMEQGADGVVQTAHSSAPTTRSCPWRETWA